MITNADLLAMEARVRAGLKQPVAAATTSIGVEEEADLHNDITEECRRRGWLPLHGSMATRTHRTVGEPDFVILCDSGRLLLVEAKAKNKKPDPKQLALHAMAAHLGHTVFVVRNMEEFHAAISTLNNPNTP